MKRKERLPKYDGDIQSFVLSVLRKKRFGYVFNISKFIRSNYKEEAVGIIKDINKLYIPKPALIYNKKPTRDIGEDIKCWTRWSMIWEFNRSQVAADSKQVVANYPICKKALINKKVIEYRVMRAHYFDFKSMKFYNIIGGDILFYMKDSWVNPLTAQEKAEEGASFICVTKNSIEFLSYKELINHKIYSKEDVKGVNKTWVHKPQYVSLVLKNPLI